MNWLRSARMLKLNCHKINRCMSHDSVLFLKGVSPYIRAKFRMLLNKGNISREHSERIQFVYCVERTVALHCRSFASRLASPASEQGSADQRGKLWARGS